MVRTLSRRTSPIKAARSKAGLTLLQASKEAGVHLQAFFLQEQGVYPEILPAIQSWLALHEYDISVATEEYHEFQRAKRKDNGERLGLSVYELGPPEGTNQFVQFRSALGLSRMGFAKDFCLHPGLLYRVEHGISKTLPQQVASALKDAGLPAWVIDELNYRIKEVA